MNNYWAFLPMRSSNDLLGDAAALRARLEEDSYLYFHKVLDDDKILALRKKMLLALAGKGLVQRTPFLMHGIAITPPAREGDELFFEAYDEVQKIEEFHTLAHDEMLLAIMRDVLGPTAFPHPLKIARLGFPAHYEVSTPPHQDFPNNQGTEHLTASWIPAGNCPRELGGLAVLRGSHRYGHLPLTSHLGPGNRQAVVPPELLEGLRWVTTDFTLGDVLVFPALTVHASLHNASEFFMRLSVDFRYQLEGEALTDIVLHPHFQRLSWDDVYAGWSSDRYQYYWKDLDYTVAPFEDLGIQRTLDITADDLIAFEAYKQRSTARFERRTARLAAIVGEGSDETWPEPPPD